MKLSYGPMRPPSFYLSWVLALTLGALIADLVLSDSITQVFKENHSIEGMSAILLLVAAGMWFGFGAHRRQPRDWHIPVILILMALRELDFDKAFTTEGILQLRLYSGAAPLWEKAIGAFFVLLILICGLRLAWFNLPRWFRGLRRGDPTSWLVGASGVLLIVAKSLDGIDRKLAPFGISFSRDFVTQSGRFEELMEMVMAILLIQAVIYYARPVRDLGAQRSGQADRGKFSARRITRSTAALVGSAPDSASSTGTHAASSASSSATGKPSR